MWTEMCCAEKGKNTRLFFGHSATVGDPIEWLQVSLKNFIIFIICESLWLSVFSEYSIRDVKQVLTQSVLNI